MIYKTSDNKELEYEIIRKDNKNIYFRVKNDLKLYVTAPMFLSKKSIEKLIKENEKSILKLYDKAENKRKDIDKYVYQGKKYYIKYDDNVDKVTFLDDTVSAKDDKMLQDFTMKSIYKIYGEEIELCKKCFSYLPNFTWKVRYMKTRWGVCNTKKNVITLNTELIKYEKDLLDYVIIHEMCHFFVGAHNHEFWDLVAKAYPNYKEARKRLKE